MRNILELLIIVLIISNYSSAQKVYYLDENYPDMIPQKYAPGIINVVGRLQQNITMSPDGKEQLITQTDSAMWRYERILRVRYMEQNKILVDTPQFVKDFKYEHLWMIGEPMISPDNKDLYFIADYPTDIWKVKIDENGKWGEPVKLDSAVNSKGSEWFPIIAQNNCLYFARDLNDKVVIHMAELVNGEYKKASILEAAFNYDCGDQVFSKNMDYIIFASPRKGGFGNNDLYIAFKKDNGEWTDGINMGPEINTEGFELAPYISPDNKYLFFTRRDKYKEASTSDIYWMSLKILNKIKEKTTNQKQ